MKKLLYNLMVMTMYSTIYFVLGTLFMISLGFLKHIIFGRWEWAIQ